MSGESALLDRPCSVSSLALAEKKAIKSSSVWDHFEEKEQGNGERRSHCKYCNVSYPMFTGSGTSNMKRHITNRHRDKIGCLQLKSNTKDEHVKPVPYFSHYQSKVDI